MLNPGPYRNEYGSVTLLIGTAYSFQMFQTLFYWNWIVHFRSLHSKLIFYPPPPPPPTHDEKSLICRKKLVFIHSHAFIPLSIHSFIHSFLYPFNQLISVTMPAFTLSFPLCYNIIHSLLRWSVINPLSFKFHCHLMCSLCSLCLCYKFVPLHAFRYFICCTVPLSQYIRLII